MLNDDSSLSELIEFQKSHPVFSERLMNFYYSSFLKPGDNFIDVGARIGHHLLPMARIVGPTGRGIGIEANPDAVEQLQDTLGKHPALANILTVVEKAAGDREGTEKFFVRNEFSGWSSLYEQHIHPNEKDAGKVITVTFVRVDDLTREAGWTQCRFMKMDIEHAEFIALRGSKETVGTMRPVICFENSPRRAAKLNNYTLAEFSSFFEDMNYDLRDIFLNPVTRQRLAYDKILPSYYLATPKEENMIDTDFVEKANVALASIRKTFAG